MSCGMRSFLAFGLRGGVNFNNWIIPYNSLSIRTCIEGMVASNIFWLLLGIYLEMAVPKTFGKSRGYCFFITCCCKQNERVKKEISEEN